MKLQFSPCIASYPAPARLGIFIVTLLLLWLPLALPIYLFLNHDPNLVTILTMGLMFLLFLGLLRCWSYQVYHYPQWLKRYGLGWSQQNGMELLKGLSIGLLLTLSLFSLEGMLGWGTWQAPDAALWRIVAEGLVSALGIGLAEELLFRGWLLDELQQDYAPNTVLWADGMIFALLHFLKPLPEMIRTFPAFPGLILLGLTLVRAKRTHWDRLGICIGLHGGLVWGYYIVNVGQLFQYRDRVSPWIVGIDGNPIAGLMGLLFLSILAITISKIRITSR